MGQEYNWKIILRSALPVGAVLVFIFFTDIRMNFKWVFMVLGLIITYFVIYFQDKKKHNVFTGVMLVLLISLIAYALKRMGLF